MSNRINVLDAYHTLSNTLEMVCCHNKHQIGYGWIKPDDRWKGFVEFNIAPYFLGKYGYQKGLESKN